MKKLMKKIDNIKRKLKNQNLVDQINKKNYISKTGNNISEFADIENISDIGEDFIDSENSKDYLNTGYKILINTYLDKIDNKIIVEYYNIQLHFK